MLCTESFLLTQSISYITQQLPVGLLGNDSNRRIEENIMKKYVPLLLAVIYFSGFAYLISEDGDAMQTCMKKYSEQTCFYQLNH